MPSDVSLNASSLRTADLDGVALTPAQLPATAQSFANSRATSADAQVQAILSAVLASPHVDEQDSSSTQNGAGSHPSDHRLKKSALGTQFLSPAKEDLVEAERQLLQQVLGLLQQATPQMEEMSMLTDALKQLDELFLLVVVGEFNSGKSSVINALLGSRSACLSVCLSVCVCMFVCLCLHVCLFVCPSVCDHLQQAKSTRQVCTVATYAALSTVVASCSIMRSR